MPLKDLTKVAEDYDNDCAIVIAQANAQEPIPDFRDYKMGYMAGFKRAVKAIKEIIKECEDESGYLDFKEDEPATYEAFCKVIDNKIWTINTRIGDEYGQSRRIYIYTKTTTRAW